MNRFFLLTTALSMLVVTACAPGGGSGTESSSGNGSAEESDSENKVLEFWYIDPGEKEKVYEEAVARFEENNPDVEVKMLRAANDAYKQKLAVSMSGGNPPDVFHSWGGGWLNQFVEEGQVLDVTDSIDKEHFNELALDNATFENEVYGLPLGLSLDLVFYNTEIFDEYGLTPPETYDELVQIIETLKENDVIPLALANQTKWPGAYYLMNFASRIGGPELFNEAFTRDGRGFDDPAYVEAGEYIQELVEMDAFNSGFNGVPYDEGQGRQLMYSGQAAMMDITISFLNNVRTEAPEFEEKLDFFVFPEVEGGEGSSADVGASTGPVWSVAAASEHPDLATELIKELTSTETAEAYTNRTGSLTGVSGVEPEDEFVNRMYQIAEEANHLQMPYDQTLPPELAELHKDTTQALFGLSMTPEEAAEKMEAKAKEDLE
ncbi:extracellular solute-binding protein [Jeotgalibacillus salarius]|uniref:Extracellular solute-binding protein n=1 Tax=Jeotgalibacillus salarius TaxID=546023 RepID=A0A4Y8LDT6_9BACL|nr:extracellular solute-binding protein [Jeotgalibacillus salarius]TFE00622.1 extracellular solute-binding protein [Jeotgalibacillus salarius]